MEITELDIEAETDLLHSFIRLLNKDLSRGQMQACLPEMLRHGYRCIAARDPVSGQTVGISGFWINTKFYCARYLEVDNFVIREDWRDKGVGRAMLRWMEQEAVKLGCTSLVLDSYTHNYLSHRFYFREGFHILGYHFFKKLSA